MTKAVKKTTDKSKKKTGKAKDEFKPASGSMADIMSAANNSMGDAVKKLGGVVGMGGELPQIDTARDPNKYLILKPWFQELTGTPGIPKGAFVTIAGPTNSGKTTLSIEAMLAAQDQGNYDILYVETEGKTTKARLESLGIRTAGIGLIYHKVIEVCYKYLNRAVDTWLSVHKNSDRRLLVVFDSLGQTTSLRDMQMDAVEDNAQVGGSAKVNTIYLKALVGRSMMAQNRISFLVVAATMKPIGVMGFNDIIKGGEVIGNSSIYIIGSKKGKTLTKKVNGIEVEIGSELIWTMRKNHVIGLKDKNGNDISGVKRIVLHATKDGLTYIGKSVRDTDDEDFEFDDKKDSVFANFDPMSANIDDADEEAAS